MLRKHRPLTLTTRWLAVLVAATAFASGTPAVARADSSPPEATASMAEARKQFQAGVNLLDDPDGAKYEEAHNAFRKAYELSQSPKVLGNIGFCAMHLERDGEAIDAYMTYLSDAPDVPERERAQIQKDLATLMSTTARVRVLVKRPAGTYVLIDTRLQTRGPNVENAYSFEGNELTVRLRPGRHTLRVKADREETVPVEITVEPASQLSRELVFPPPKVDAPMFVRRSPSVAGPVVLGVTGFLALGAGAVAGLVARGKTKDIEARCPNDVCPTEYDLETRRGSAKTFGTVADASFAAGGVLVASALVWYALLPRGSSAQAPIAAMCTHDGCNLQLQRGF
jgi:hypothetical protein